MKHGSLLNGNYAPKGSTLNGNQHQDIKIIDVDTHITEAPDLWTSRAPAGLKDKMPYTKHVDGVDRWFVQDRPFGLIGGNVINPKGDKLHGRLGFPTFETGHAGAWDMKARTQFMDANGIYAQIAYQNSGVTQAGSLLALGDNDVALTIIKLFNDAAHDNQVKSGQRVFPMAQLPIWGRQELNREARRCVEDLKIRGFSMPDTPEHWGLPSYEDAYWTEFLELCEASATPLNFHLSSGMDGWSLTWGSMRFEQRLAVTAMMQSLGCAATLGNFIISGLLDRHPALKICLVESGIGWVTFALEALEHQINEMIPDRAVRFQRTPKEYFKDQFYATFWFEEAAPMKHLAELGYDNVMFETDFPHPTSLYPMATQHAAHVLNDYPIDVKRRILQENAARLYKIEV